jgi:phosphoribosyl 1,2-cyclic phosphate phosphodiesterase
MLARFMGNFTFTFLGTGTSQGIPMLTCDCAVCRSTDPRDKRTRASAYVETPECAWVVDTGPDFRQQALRENIRRVDAVLLTHAHTDHIMGFDDLRAFCHGGKVLPVFGSAETLGQLQRSFSFAFDGKNRFPGYINPEVRTVDGPFRLGETEIIPLPVPHGRMTTYGFLFKRGGRPLLAYLSDCKAVPDAIRTQIAGVDTLVLDALRRREHPTHMSVAEAVETAAVIRPRLTLFTHLCHDLAHAETETSLPENVRIATDGMKLTF